MWFSNAVSSQENVCSIQWNDTETLVCNYSNLDVLEQESYIELATESMKLLLNKTSTYLQNSNIDVSLSDLGFYYF